MPDEPKRSRVFQLYLSDAEYAELQRLSTSYGQSASAMLRMMIVRFAKQERIGGLQRLLGTLSADDPKRAETAAEYHRMMRED